MPPTFCHARYARAWRRHDAACHVYCYRGVSYRLLSTLSHMLLRCHTYATARHITSGERRCHASRRRRFPILFFFFSAIVARRSASRHFVTLSRLRRVARGPLIFEKIAVTGHKTYIVCGVCGATLFSCCHASLFHVTCYFSASARRARCVGCSWAGHVCCGRGWERHYFIIIPARHSTDVDRDMMSAAIF